MSSKIVGFFLFPVEILMFLSSFLTYEIFLVLINNPVDWLHKGWLNFKDSSKIVEKEVTGKFLH